MTSRHVAVRAREPCGLLMAVSARRLQSCDWPGRTGTAGEWPVIGDRRLGKLSLDSAGL